MKLLILILLFFCSLWGHSQIKEVTIEVVSEKQTTQSILKQAEEEFTYTIASEILGQDGAAKIETAIKEKIVPKSKNFILLTKVVDKKEYEDNDKKNEKSSNKKFNDKNSEEEILQKFTYSIFIKYSPETLRNVLLQEGIYYMDEGAHKILPLIEFVDEEEGYENAWWTQKNDSSLNYIQNFYSSLQRLFIQDGFYLLNPSLSQYAHRLPSKLSTKYLNVKKAQKISQYFQAQFFIIGRIKISPLSKNQYQSLWDLTLYSTPHLRKLDSYKFRTELSKKSWSSLNQYANYWVENFILQIKNIYETGALSTQVFTIEVLGDLTYLEKEKMRKALVKDIPSIQSLKTHYVSAQKERYQADVKGTDQEVLNKLKNWKFLDFQFQSYLKSKNYIIVRVKKSQ